ILTLYDSINVIDVNKVVEYIQSLQKEDGSFAGVFGEKLIQDSLFLDAIHVEKAIEFVLSRMNFDGGFGCRPGSESHAGQDSWLLLLPSGGLNGRPEKLPGACYSWRALASLKIIGRLHWIDREKLHNEETGGSADRPGDMVVPFHTLFGIAGLSLLGEEQIKPVSPVFCMPDA
ncbi:hypothetical protein EI555_004739, partial [Monodon monoceros]